MIYLFWFYILTVVVSSVLMVLGIRHDLSNGVDYTLLDVLKSIFCVVCPVLNIVFIFYGIWYFNLMTNPTVLQGKRGKQ